MIRRLLFACAMLPALSRAQVIRLTEAEQSALADLAPEFATEFTLRHGWYRDRPVEYFDFGPMPFTSPVAIVPVTGFDARGMPIPEPDGRVIFASLPGLPDYSSIWRVQFLVVDSGVTMTGVRDARAATQLVLRGVAHVVTSKIFADFPIVPHGSALAGDPARRRLLGGWYKGVEVRYFDFGRTSFEPVPLWTFRSGTDSTGAPGILRDQANIVDRSPGADSSYSDIWDIHLVHVDSTYAPQTWRSWPALRAGAAQRGYGIVPAGQLRNCPIVLIDGRIAGRQPVVEH